ncbi:MAG: 4Fe-4S dicluster domain-containing protein [Ignavibacteriae bacterium]|nr:MAG: 4Fe-4S dicluster domain-containing protein [Ignavibacteriota bacterium]
MIKLTIDGKQLEVFEDTSILKAAEKAGIWIPTMCHCDYIEPYGVCRLCSVEVVKGKRSRIVTACNYPVREGLTVRTNSERVKWIRKIIMELMLSRWPNVPAVKEMAEQLGISKPRFESKEKDEAEDACILCGMCVNVCNDLVGKGVLGFSKMGIEREVVLPYNERSEECIACGACAYVCPTKHIKVKSLEYERGAIQDWSLASKTAIYVPTMQAVPRVPTIDEASCINKQTGGCKACQTYCEPGAINYDMKDEEIEVEVGQILITTGYQLMDLTKMPQFGYGRLDNVYSSLDFEHMLNSTGPTNGTIQCKDGSVPRAVGIIHCIGSRDENYHKYCSRVCCMYALKFAHLIKDRTTAEVYQFYIDMRAFGKGYEEFYKRLLDEGVNMIRGKVGEVTECRVDGEKPFLKVACEDTLIGKFREIPLDMVILCPAIESNADSSDLKKIFSISQSPDKFFLERHPKLDPMSTMTDGIFIAGCAQGPKDIPDSVAQASGAAAKILSLISVGEVAVDPIKAEIVEERCSGCRICNNLCPYGAISYIDEKKISFINDMLCKGCGTCVAACPSSVITGKGFTDAQIMAEIEGLLAI